MYYCVLHALGLHRSIQLEDIMKYKCYEGERMDKVCQEFSEKVRVDES